MPNGVRLPLACVPASASVESAIESAIGTALADAASELGQALAEYRGAGLTAHTRKAGGDALAWLYALREESLGELDFHAVARREGRLALTQRLATVGASADEAALDVIVSDVLTLVDGVAERAVAN